MRSFLYCFFIVFFCVHVSVSYAQTPVVVSSGGGFFCDTINSDGFVSVIQPTVTATETFSVTVQYWQTSIDNGLTWVNLPTSNFTQLAYNNITKTTWFRAVVTKDSVPASLFPPFPTTVSIVTIYPYAKAGLLTGGGSFCVNTGSGILTLTGTQGAIQYWQSSITNGLTWDSIPNTTTSHSYTSITQNTLFRAIASNVIGCPSDTSNTISFLLSTQTIPGTVAAASAISDTICRGQNGDTLFLTGNNGNVLNWESSINNGATWNTIASVDSFRTYLMLDTTTWYRAIVKHEVCPALSTNTVKLVIVNPQKADAGADNTIVRFKNCVLNGSGSGSPAWYPPLGLDNSLSFTPTANPLVTTTYTLTLTDRHFCVTEDSMTVTVIVPIPSAITPNGDGVNDAFEIDKISDYPSNSLSIVDRWGIEVYKASPYKNDWKGVTMKGVDLPDDIYYYVFDYGTSDKGIASGYILIKR